EHLGAGRAVDRRVVDLGQDADIAVGEAADYVPLPEWPSPVEGPSHDPCDLLGELALVAGRRDCDLAEMELQVHVGIVDPVRGYQTEWIAHELPAVHLQQVQPLVEHPPDIGVDVP